MYHWICNNQLEPNVYRYGTHFDCRHSLFQASSPKSIHNIEFTMTTCIPIGKSTRRSVRNRLKSTVYPNRGQILVCGGPNIIWRDRSGLRGTKIHVEGPKRDDAPQKCTLYTTGPFHTQQKLTFNSVTKRMCYKKDSHFDYSRFTQPVGCCTILYTTPSNDVQFKKVSHCEVSHCDDPTWSNSIQEIV